MRSTSRWTALTAASLAAVALIGAVSPPVALAASADGGFVYETDEQCGVDGSLRITGYRGDLPVDLDIPDAIDGRAVTSIASAPTDGARGFDGAGIVSLSLPDSLSCIEAQTFAHNRLASLTLPAGLTQVGTGSFADNEIAALTVHTAPDALGVPFLAQHPRRTVPRPPSGDVIALRELLGWSADGQEATWTLTEASSASLPDGVTWDAARQGFVVAPGVSSFVFTPTMEGGYDGFGSSAVDYEVTIAAP